MATMRGNLGQTAKVLFAMAFTDGTGLATDPTGTPVLTVYYVNPNGSLSSVATLNLAKLMGVTGFWGAFQDISNVATWPAGDYQLSCSPTIAGIVTTLTDTFEIDPAALGASGGFISGAYCSEAQVRLVTTALSNVAQAPPATIIEMAVRASRHIDMRLRARYVVPFVPTYDDGIVLLAIELAAGYTLRNVQGERGNLNALGETLIAAVEEELADIANGITLLSVLVRTDNPDGMPGMLSSSLDRSPTISVTANTTDSTGDSPMKDFV
jgi:hypothetical protein